MRILHVIQRYWPYVGGSERQLQEFSERLVRDGHQVTVYTSDAWDLEHFWAQGKRTVPEPSADHNGVRIRRFRVRHLAPFALAYPVVRRVMLALSDLPVDLSPALFGLAQYTPWIPDLAAALEGEQERYDLVAGMNIVFDSLLLPALRFARRTGAPFVIHPLTHLGEEHERKVRRYYTMRHQLRLLKESDALVIQTERERAALAALGVPPGKMFCVGSGVNPGDVQGGDGERFRREHGIAGPLVAYVGTAAFDKGAHHSLQAVKMLREQGVDATLVFAGPTMDQFTSFYRRQAAGVQSYCRVLGFVPDDVKQDLLAACNVLVLPSRTDSFGIVFLEAWLYGKPVIGAAAGGIPDVISDGVDGYLVPFGDAPALAGRLRRLLADGDLARQMGEQGRAKVLRQMTWRHRYQRLRRVYESLHDTWSERGTRAGR